METAERTSCTSVLIRRSSGDPNYPAFHRMVIPTELGIIFVDGNMYQKGGYLVKIENEMEIDLREISWEKK